MSLQVLRSSIVNNVADEAGGGIYIGGNGNNFVETTTISGNQAIWGGGIRILLNQAQSGQYFEVRQSTVAYNVATQYAGGILYNDFDGTGPNRPNVRITGRS